MINLQKSYKRVWVFGDSFSTPEYCVEPKDSFWGLTASHVGAQQVVNCSWPGNSFTSVCHSLISNQQEYDWQNDLFLIGIPPLERITVFDNHKDTASYGHRFDTATWQGEQFEVNSHHGLETLLIIDDAKYKKMVAFEDRSWTEVMAMQTIFLLNAWLDSQQAHYLIINLSKPLDINNLWRPSEFLLSAVSDHSRNIIFKDTYQSVNQNLNKPMDFDEYGWDGHHGPAGNRHFFETSLRHRFR